MLYNVIEISKGDYLTMNKIVLNTDDVNYLFDWRDNHNEMVRKGLVPIKDIEIEINKEMTIKAYRKADNLTEYIYNRNKPVGKLNFILLSNGMWEITKEQLQLALPNKKDFIESCLSIYGTIMAFFVYGNTPPAEYIESTNISTTKTNIGNSNSKKNKSNKKQSSITYILKNYNGERKFTTANSHKSPQGQFSVRGHYRHLPNGNIIWINQYTKGNGKKNKTTYKVGEY